MNYKSISQEAKLCRAAFKDAKVGDLVWFWHNDTPIEILNDQPENRISYILFNKPKVERAARLHWFRPCKIDLPPELDAALSNLAAACSEWDKWDATYSKRDAAQSNLDATNSAWNVACSKYADEINTLVKLYLPGCPWDDHTLFPEE